MFKKINNTKFYYLIGVYSSNGTLTFQFMHISLKNENIEFVKSKTFPNFQDLIDNEINRDYPIIIHFDGDNVISKKTEHKKGYKKDLVFKISPDDFYFFEVFQENFVFVSLIRKITVDSIISKLNEKNKYIVDVSVGPFIISQLHTLFKDNNTVYTFSHEVQINRELISSFTKTGFIDKKTQIADKDLSQTEISLIATIYNYLQGNEHIKIDNHFLALNIEQSKFKSLYKLVATITVSVIVFLLFIGHFSLNYHISKLAEHEYKFIMAQQTISQIEKLESDNLLKEKILQNSGVIDINYMTKFVAEIGNIVPPKILLTKIEVSPLKKKVKPNEEIFTQNDLIIINGEAFLDNEFNTFIKQLNDLDWINKVEIIDYQKEKSINTFELKIKKKRG